MFKLLFIRNRNVFQDGGKGKAGVISLNFSLVISCESRYWSTRFAATSAHSTIVNVILDLQVAPQASIPTLPALMMSIIPLRRFHHLAPS